MIKKISLTLKAIRNINIFILDFLKIIRNKDVVYKTRNGVKIIARAGTTDAGEIVIVHADMEYPKRYFPQKEEPVILDIGANIGAFSIYLCKELEAKDPTIYAIEPSGENFYYLKRNVSLNGFSSIRCFNIAIFDKNGAGYIDTNCDYDAFSVLDEKNKSTDCDEIDIVTLESFCEDNHVGQIDLMKIDIEGGEYRVFNKSINFIKSNIRSIFIELHNLNEVDNINRFKEYIVVLLKIFPNFWYNISTK